MKTIATLAATAALFAVSPLPAFAQVAGGERTVVIPTAGLDLAGADGHRRLDARIRAAAFAACDASPADLRGRNHAANCRAQIIAAARAERDTRLVARRTVVELAARR